MLIFRLNSVPSRTQQALYKLQNIWNGGANVQSEIEPLAVNRDHLGRLCRTNVSLNEVVCFSLVYVALTQVREQASSKDVYTRVNLNERICKLRIRTLQIAFRLTRANYYLHRRKCLVVSDRPKTLFRSSHYQSPLLTFLSSFLEEPQESLVWIQNNVK